jgi:serine/threonine protein kinase
MVAMQGKLDSDSIISYRVKLAVDLKTNKRVAIKFLKVSKASSICKHKALEFLIKEIKILAECDHPNIAKIIEASLDGVLIKEYPSATSTILQKNSRGTTNLQSEFHMSYF